MTEAAVFGHPVRQRYFNLDPNYRNLNHGSYGTEPLVVQETRNQLLLESQANPDLWFRVTSLQRYQASCDFAAQCLGIDPHSSHSVVLCRNTSTGIMAVVRSLVQMQHEKVQNGTLTGKGGSGRWYLAQTWLNYFGSWRSGLLKMSHSVWGAVRSLMGGKPTRFKILCFDFAYIQVKQMLDYLDHWENQLDIIMIPTSYPLSEEQLLETWEQAIHQHHCPRSPIILAILDAISSVPAMILPYQRLTEICHKQERRIPVLLDGAHAVGQIPFHPLWATLSSYAQPDFFVTNFHKWAFASRGCAALYVHPAYHSYIVPPIVSAGYHSGRGTLRQRFQWTGTDDVSNFFTIESAWTFRRDVLGGEERIQQYTHTLAVEGGRLVAKALGTEMLFDGELWRIPSMSNVLLPPGPDELYANLGLEFLKRYNLYLVTFKYSGFWWTRLSAQVFNELSDFEYAAQCLREYLYEKLNIIFPKERV